MLAIGAVALLVVLTAAGLSVAAAVEASHRARLAADLAALAGAEAVRPWLTGSGPRTGGCARADSVARANGAVLRRCTVHGTDIEVVVAVRVRGGAGQAVARAAAGPATPGRAR
ncbi:pilus assembly protein TadE [Intrasporangium oryzae NRRL B-24470]|uniref:Pilus assembly protein TadE n=1 Tax=Intrasporangium oryzae NRRL B-24470 TaxID=1386089 RepID=W9GC75_9MICO|nr:pilus assembly protein TadE [Intrasporangium oryzae NRRL B-24470]